MDGKEVFNHVLKTIADYAVKHHDFSNAEKCIMYMNGNDGTGFDWAYNSRTCEFMIFFDEEKCGISYGFIKADVNTRGHLECIRYTDFGREVAKTTILHRYSEEEAEALVSFLRYTYDSCGRWDNIVYHID